jgi:hypothetical protein
MFLDSPQIKKNKSETAKKKITIKVPLDLWDKLRLIAKENYSGRGKQSQLINDAVAHFLKISNFQSIDWSDPLSDDLFLEIATHIRLGANMKNLNPNPVQAFIRIELYKDLVELESSIKGAKQLLDYHVKPAVIRRAISQWMYADKSFLQKIKGL